MMQGWGFTGGRAGYPQKFQEQYHCFSVAYADKSHLEKGDKILLPPSAFDTLARLQVDYPMLFRLESPIKGTMTHSGVLEFTAEEGSCYIPFWMMQNLLIEEGSVISVTNISLPKATFVKLQPQHVDFLEITNPRAVLEHALRNFSCVTKGDVICIPYNSKNYHFELKEVKPQDAACIIETDCNVDFDAPVGYKDNYSNTNGSDSNDKDTNGKNNNNDNTASINSDLINLPRQRADGGEATARSSACPSPAVSSMSGASGGREANSVGADDVTAAVADCSKLRIVDGKVIQPEDTSMSSYHADNATEHAMLAEKTGATGVQRNAAIPLQAPEIDYWAVNAGDGARLDGKTPAQLKDASGNELDIRKIRAEAAAKRLQAAEAAANAALPKGGGITVEGNVVEENDEQTSVAAPSKRKSRVGGKYSRLKNSAKKC